MRAKVQQRKIAEKLRRQGKSYREIMMKVPVSKGTLSKWFAHLPLAAKEERYLEERLRILQDNGRLKTAASNRKRNEKRRERVVVNARVDFEKYKDDPFFVLGLSLYWATGTQKDEYWSFTSKDPRHIKLMMAWASQYLLIDPVQCRFRLYVHKTRTNDADERFWSRTCAIPRSQFQSTVYTPQPKQRVEASAYHGSLRMIIPGINHLIAVRTWQEQLSLYYIDAL